MELALKGDDNVGKGDYILNVIVLSGVWAVGCCQHGSVYMINYRYSLESEGQRDIVDMERSLIHRPIRDIAHLAAKMGNKIQSDFYGPNKARLLEATQTC